MAYVSASYEPDLLVLVVASLFDGGDEGLPVGKGPAQCLPERVLRVPHRDSVADSSDLDAVAA